jgi:serine/threonine protein kinase
VVVRTKSRRFGFFMSTSFADYHTPCCKRAPTFHDRYRVLRRIGRGGMGAVYEAVDTRLRNTVAVKQLEIAGAAADRAFEREAQLLAGLRHPVLPVVIDYFSAAQDAFLVMQYIEGEDLEQHLGRQQRPCEREEVIAWANALLDGLEYLHSRSPSIIHRDIKPSNVKRTPAGDVVLLDFGLAKGRLDTDDTTARDNSLYGFTLQYAPLEQIDRLGTDVRSDLFALGATLYHLATGAPPPRPCSGRWRSKTVCRIRSSRQTWCILRSDPC